MFAEIHLQQREPKFADINKPIERTEQSSIYWNSFQTNGRLFKK